MASSVALVYFRATAAFPRTQHLRQSATSSAAKVRSRNHVNPMADLAERRGGCQTRSKSSDALPNQDGETTSKPLVGTSSYLQMQRERTFILHVAGQRVAVGT